VHCDDNSLATGVVSGTAIVLGDGLRIHAGVLGVNTSSSGALNPGSGVGAGGRLIPAGSYESC
jgi:hypothetical protein